MISPSFAKLWMSAAGGKEAKRRADFVLSAMRRHFPNAKTVLELGVGLGDVLLHFPNYLNISGLDIEKGYVDICKERLSRGDFFVADMSDFKVGKSFDVLFSVFGSINLLKNFDQWLSTFKCAYAHLNPAGLFIIDIYTLKKLEYFKDKKPTLSEFEMGYTSGKANVKGDTLTWDLMIFERTGSDKYLLHKGKVVEKMYPISDIKASLSKDFEILETKLLDEGRRLLVICRKR